MSTNCHYCGKNIKVLKQNRVRQYCSDRCKQAAYRARKRWQEKPDLVDKQIEERLAKWHQENLPDTVIEELMKLWYDYGGEAMIIGERMMLYYQLHMLGVMAEKTKNT